MDVRITRFVRFANEGSLKAFCDVAIERLILIKGIRVVEGREGPFISMPRQQSKNGKWYDSAVLLTRELKCELARVVLDAYHTLNFTASAFQEDACGHGEDGFGDTELNPSEEAEPA